MVGGGSQSATNHVGAAAAGPSARYLRAIVPMPDEVNQHLRAQFCKRRVNLAIMNQDRPVANADARHPMRRMVRPPAPAPSDAKAA
ncbi:MAG: hypothetical protein C0499_01700, partial [Zymomonas sp.]|nr:hypothetical protein [Zymomonas sp.]